MDLTGRFLVVALALLTAACAHQQPASQAAGKPLQAKPESRPQVVEKKSTASMEEVLSRHQMADDILMRAMALIGTPYRWGGSSPQTGFDCSGLIGYVFADSLGMKLPRSTREMIQLKAPVIGKDKLRSGDIVFFATNGGRGVSHAGIYVGDGRFVHAPSTGGKVRMDHLDSAYWSKAYLQAKRYLPDQSSARSF